MALARAQSWFGYGRGLDRFAVITLGVGAGLGVVIHGELVESPDSGIGLIGHFPLDATGPLCYLADQGQLAAEAVVDQAARALGRLVAAVANLTTCYRILVTGEAPVSPQQPARRCSNRSRPTATTPRGSPM